MPTPPIPISPSRTTSGITIFTASTPKLIDVGEPSEGRGLVCAYLAGLQREEFVRRIVAIADRDKDLELALLIGARAAGGSLELAAEKDLTAMFRVPSRHLSWHESREYAQQAESALDVLEGLLAAGRAKQVVTLAEHVIKRLDAALGQIDDSGGFLGLPVARVADIHLRACGAARQEPRKLAVRLLETALKSDWEWFLDAPEA